VPTLYYILVKPSSADYLTCKSKRQRCKYRAILWRLGSELITPKSGFPFSGKSRATDFLRSLAFQMCADNLIRCAWLLVFQKKVVAKSRLRDFFHSLSPSTLENREFIKQNLTTFSWSRIKITKMASLINRYLILFQCFMWLCIYALYFRTYMTSSYDVTHFFTISRLHARQESPPPPPPPSGKFSSTALVGSIKILGGTPASRYTLKRAPKNIFPEMLTAGGGGGGGEGTKMFLSCYTEIARFWPNVF
jgi:hypothetical protein